MDIVTVALGGLADQKYINRAPAPYVNSDGSVTLLGINFADSGISQVIEVDGVTADTQLDNNILSGLVLPADSPVIEQLGAIEPQSYSVIITDFAGLPDHVREGVRSTILSQAPFATMNDTDDPEMRQLRAQVIARQIFTFIVSGALLLALVATMVADQRLERRLVELSGGSRLTRMRLVFPLLFAYAFTVISAVVLGRLTAMERVPFTYRESAAFHDYGWGWTWGFACLLFLLPALVIAARPASTEGGRT